jgi:D-serine deaminase-like pyridoxal phosphate-dependent protein
MTVADQTRSRLDRATADLEPPFAVVDLAAFDRNATAMATRAGAARVRVASKSVRCRDLLTRALAMPGWHGIMAFTLPEANWLVRREISDDVLVAYPTANRAALRDLGTDPRLAACVTLMVDSPDHLDFIDAVLDPGQREPIRVCIDLDASWRLAGGRVHVGVRRSPVHGADEAARLARMIVDRPGFRLVGLMSYEAQIAGLGDRPPGQALRGAAIRAMQRRSHAELLQRRGEAVTAVRRHADLEFVNGGGTGSIAATAADPSVTEVTAGSGLYGPTLFDGYRAWRPRPAAFFALPVVRRPGPGFATVLGGGWIASGPPGASRQPSIWLPRGLRLMPSEGAGEVQTPITGPAADQLRIGDRVWFRHAKAGELCEHVEELHCVQNDRIISAALTYRGDRHAFL